MKKRVNKKSILNYSFPVAVISAILTVFIMLTGCETSNEDESENGVLKVKFQTWNTYGENVAKSFLKSSHSLDLIDIRSYKYEMKFTTDEIQEGKSDSDINWITAYTSSEMMLDSERDFDFELPAGTYRGFALLQGRDLFWVLSDGSKTIEIPTSNGGSGDKVYNVFGLNGLYILDSDGMLEKVQNDEKIGTSFTIVAGMEHSLTVRMNLNKIDWHDNDDSGDWSDGDEYDGPTVPDGVETMMDFIFE